MCEYVRVCVCVFVYVCECTGHPRSSIFSRPPAVAELYNTYIYNVLHVRVRVCVHVCVWSSER